MMQAHLKRRLSEDNICQYDHYNHIKSIWAWHDQTYPCLSTDVVKLFSLLLAVKLQLTELHHTVSHSRVMLCSHLFFYHDRHLQSLSKTLQVQKNLIWPSWFYWCFTVSLIFPIAPQDPWWTMLLSDACVSIQPAPSPFPPLPPLLTHWCFSFHQLHHIGWSHGS